MSSAQAKQIILNVAALTNQLLTEEKPALDAEIPRNEYFDKCRFEGNLPRIVLLPALKIRKHPKKIFTLEDYVEQGILTEKQREIIIRAIHDKKNIIAAGGTKSGKTTLLNALLAETSKLNDRVILIEDMLLRLKNMTARVSQNPQQATIGQAVNLIIYLKYVGKRQIVEDIIEVKGYNATRQEYNLKKLV